ncbi:Solanesyl diphosphate synthase 3 [Hibiscus syriacus]|uniref:Solanesyl diphosphate synthase 3 n=1 Tax=Hibiscus syriacus TaxID=106335 RepID=A0A6A3CUU8_HIBSY|nr:Solanesyl diphosphate synthase 3 [Hibiscus syriacus]
MRELGYGRHLMHFRLKKHILERLDPFSIVADELSLIATRLRSMVAAEVPNLASAAEYFFKIGAEGKRFRPTVLLLMATALNVHIPELPPAGVGDTLSSDLRTRQQRIAEITEMIHTTLAMPLNQVASLLHDDVLDDADTRRGVGSLNAVMGNKVVTLIATVVENLVTGETMQLTTASTQRFSDFLLLLFNAEHGHHSVNTVEYRLGGGIYSPPSVVVVFAPNGMFPSFPLFLGCSCDRPSRDGSFLGRLAGNLGRLVTTLARGLHALLLMLPGHWIKGPDPTTLGLAELVLNMKP